MSSRGKTLRAAGLTLLVVLLLIAAYWIGARHGGGSSAEVADHAAETVWTCSMHPQIRLPAAGQCPVCYMDLIPLENDLDAGADPATLELTPAAAALAEIETRPVRRDFVDAEVRLVGHVDYAESRYRKITAWASGRLDTLFVATTGETVAAGQPLVSIYSPELLSAQTELLSAAAAARTTGTSDALAETTRRTLDAARDRLRQWGLTPAQIADIERSDVATEHLRILAPVSGVVVEKDALEGTYVRTGENLYTIADLSRVWVELEAFESDLPFLRVGQPAAFTLEALPGRSFTGRVVFIDPVLDRRTRTATVRLESENTRRDLKPGMFVRATVAAALDAAGRPLLDTAGAEAPLVVPATAPLLTGRRAVVYVREPGDAPRFTGREVVLGPRAGDHYLVVSGLDEGEQVVVRGNFKIDSALQILARPSMMNPAAGHDAAHDHAPGTAPLGHPGPDFPPTLAAAVDAYLELQSALAGDAADTARAAADALRGAVAAVEAAGSAGDLIVAWERTRRSLDGQLVSLLAADDIAGVRAGFDPLSDTLWALLARLEGSAAGDATLRLFHCPMYGDGGDWIQTAAEAANPYFGASMLRCGSQTDTLSVAAAR